jgi:transposase
VDAKRLAEIGEREPALLDFTATRKDIEARKMLSLCAFLETTRQRLQRVLNDLDTTSTLLGLSIDHIHVTRALEEINEAIRVLKKTVCTDASATARTLADTMPGLSLDHAAMLEILLSGKHFKDRDQLVAFAGLDVRARRSGSWRGRERLSKRSNPYLRKLLYHIGWGLSRYHPVYKAYYQQLRERKLHYTTAIIATARKFLRYYFVVYWGRLSSKA